MKEEQDIYVLIDRYLAGKAKPEEIKRLEEWRSIPENEEQFADLKELHRLTTSFPQISSERSQTALEGFWNKVSDAPESIEAPESIPSAQAAPPPANPPATPIRRIWPRYSVVAAVAAAIVLLLLFRPWEAPSEGAGWYPNGFMTETKRGETKRFHLADGSSIHLNSESKLEIGTGFGEGSRNVKLEGEAFFQVAKDPSNPFRITSNQLTTTVLGTSFNIRAYPGEGHQMVAVKTGKVKVDAEEGHWFLTPGKQAGIENGIAGETTIEDDPFAWTENRWVYKNVPLERIVNDLGRRFPKEFVLDPAISQEKITASFEKESLSEIIQAITLSLGIQHAVSNDSIFLRSHPAQP